MSDIKKDRFNDYLKTYWGVDLLKKHSLTEVGIWQVRGEDPNCDFSGSHYMPVIGHFEGKLEDVIRYGVELPSFWTWGAGGDFTLIKAIKVNSLSARVRKELVDEREALLEKLESVNTVLGVS